MHPITKYGVAYKAFNSFGTDEKRGVHLIKTLRNNGSGLNTRLLWNNGKYLLGKHDSECYERECIGQVKKLSELTNEHISLNSHSEMRVNLDTTQLDS